jgi:hypothetical protein
LAKDAAKDEGSVGMKIEKREKIDHGTWVQNQICRDVDSNSACTHNDADKKLMFARKVESPVQLDLFVCLVEAEVVFCPYCGFSYGNN